MPVLEVASRVSVTRAEGPHRRYALWVQGCDLRCPGCCNPALLPPGRGTRVDVSTLLEEIAGAAERHRLEGITILGGEPLQQLPAVITLCRGVVALGLGVLVFSGYRLRQAQALAGFDELWPLLDTLVDGRYRRDQPEPALEHGGRRFIGSANQRLVHRSDRYRDPELWTGRAQVEVHIEPNGAISAHGEPQTLGTLLQTLQIHRRRRF